MGGGVGNVGGGGELHITVFFSVSKSNDHALIYHDKD